jgi:Domain of unknown function (DUF1918)
MQAHSGDWLVVRSHTDGGHVRRGAILATHADGAPPYSVRWLDDDRESVVFPGPDAQIIPANDEAERDRAHSELIDKAQSGVSSHLSGHSVPPTASAEPWSPPKHWLTGAKLQA